MITTESAGLPVPWQGLPRLPGRPPVLGSMMVATSQPLAAQAGLQALREGGNAVDAALAAAITLTVVEPVSNGLGGDLFALIWDPRHPDRCLGLNASGRSPRAWSAQRFSGATLMPMSGWEAVTVPGAVKGWHQLSARLGRLPFERLFADAIRHADLGFPVSPVVAGKWAREAQRLSHVPGFDAQFLVQGRSPRTGERFRPPHQAETLRELARSGAASFYTGALADAMVADARRHGAALSHEDLQAHWAEDGWMRPVSIPFRGQHIHQMPPNGQGVATLLAMGVLDRLDPTLLARDGLAAQHLAIEAMKQAFVDTYRAVADPAAMLESVDDLLAPDRLAKLAAALRTDRAQDFGAAIPPWGGTVYVCAADQDGCLVSLIQSNFVGIGSGVVVPGTGISLHNRGAGFTLRANHPNQVAGGKRPFHTIIPALVSQGDIGRCALGVTGGPIQPQGQVQLLLSMLAWGLNPQEAVERPRWKLEHQHGGVQLDLEAEFPPELGQGLRALGHMQGPPGITGGDFGGAFVIQRLASASGEPAVWAGGADPRRDGQVVSF